LLITREKRVLLIVNCLAEHGDLRFRGLYEFIEKAGVEIAFRYLGRHYRLISVLKEQEAGLGDFLWLLQKLTTDSNNLAVDLFFQLHGLKHRVCFFDRWVSTNYLSRAVKEVVKKDCLRLLYNTSCYGDSHSAAFLRAGFRVAVGALKVNASSATEYPLFCNNWKGSSYSASRRALPVAEVLRKADRPLPRRIQDRIAGRYFKDVDSKKILRGDTLVQINKL
jgi:hypothetical protein